MEGIRRGTLPLPSRNIRFILGFEAVGEMAYLLRNKARLAKTVGWINIDMVGSNAADKAILDVYHNPWATWSYCDTLAPALIREYQCFTRDKFGFGEKGYEILDNLAADPMFGVPTISMIMCPAESYHSSIDTMERVDPKVLKRSGLITGALAYFLSSADAGAIRWLLEEIRVHAYTTLTQVARQRWYAAYPLACAFRRGCLSLRRLADGGDEELLEEIALTAESLPSPSRVDLAGLVSAEWKSRAEKRIPVRLVEGCLTSQTLPKNATDAARWRLYFRYRWNCPLFLADGARNIYEIACLAAAELGIDNVSGYLQELIEFFDFLKKYNYVRLDMADGE